uniref:Pectinesterase inhibitor n=1 Tax=Rhizophora mucronata TaxID=61149 RepID=A0A2P2QT17_RHIMU
MIPSCIPRTQERIRCLCFVFLSSSLFLGCPSLINVWVEIG